MRYTLTTAFCGTAGIAVEIPYGKQPARIQDQVLKQGYAYTGVCRLKQTAFGIRPISVGGLVKVRDELEIQFSVIALTHSVQ